MLFLFAHFLKKNKIKLDSFDDKKYLIKVKEKYNLEDYLVDIIENNRNDINEIIKDKKMYNDAIIGTVKSINTPERERERTMNDIWKNILSPYIIYAQTFLYTNMK